jgi:hypothetical protein
MKSNIEQNGTAAVATTDHINNKMGDPNCNGVCHECDAFGRTCYDCGDFGYAIYPVE